MARPGPRHHTFKRLRFETSEQWSLGLGQKTIPKEKGQSPMALIFPKSFHCSLGLLKVKALLGRSVNGDLEAKNEGFSEEAIHVPPQNPGRSVYSSGLRHGRHRGTTRQNSKEPADSARAFWGFIGLGRVPSPREIS